MMVGYYFPQGTTKSFCLFKGTAHIIKEHRPIVVPIVDGFRRSFDKKGLRMKRKEFCNRLLLKSLLKLTMIMIRLMKS
jgi:hypothetical protein